MKMQRSWALVAALVLASAVAQATVVDLDLNNFYTSGNVSVSADGRTGILAEDEEYGPLMCDDPFLGDPILIVPDTNMLLEFDYDFQEGLENDDTFSFYLIHPVDGPMGFGSPYFATFDGSASGSIQWDLTPFAGLGYLGLGFEMGASDTLLDSTATVSNVRLITEDGDVVPEPATLSLVGLGLAGLQLRYWRRRKG